VVRSIALVLALASGCGPTPLVCGEGEDPVVVTGLSGTIDGTPAVEIQARVPMDCTVVGATWMFWNESDDSVSLSDPPEDGVLERDGIDAGDRTIVFTELDLGLRLDYPGEDVAPELALVWFAAGMDLETVDCTASADALACEVRP
jgi:hypothetical protein